MIGFLFKSLTPTQIQTVCEKVQDFLEINGAAKLTRKKNSESSYEDTHKVLNIASSCLELASENSTVNLRLSLKKAIGNIALNSLQLNQVCSDTHFKKKKKSKLFFTKKLIFLLSKCFQFFFRNLENLIFLKK